jgi:hypothetical protein
MLACKHFAAMAVTIAFVGSAAAGAWPDRAVRIVYPYAAGSAGDAAARLLATRLGDGFGQPFIVENRRLDAAIIYKRCDLFKEGKKPYHGRPQLAVYAAMAAS